MAIIALSPIPPIPSPGDRDFEAKIGKVLSHMPTLATELKTIAETVVESAQLVDVEGNATVAATAASQASISANSAMSAGATATTQANNAKAEATKAARSKSDAALAASQSGTNAVAALGAAERAEAAVLAAEAIAASKAEEVATQAAADAATQAVSGVIAQAQASADAAALSATDANTAKNAAQTAATTAGQSVAAIATHAQTASTAATTASNHAHNAGLRAAEALASAQQATSAGQAATQGAADVREILDNLETGPVVSVNGKFGAVNLVPSDVGAAPSAHVGATGTAHGAATTSAAGFMSAADKTKLDGVAAGATAYIHPATHPASIITQDANNRFVSDTEKTAWNAKEAGGTAAAAMTAHTGATDPHTQYLPKAGGTMTGAVTFAGAQTWPTFNQSTTGNAATATKLATERALTIGSNSKTFDGSSNLSWSLSEIGAQAELVSGTNIRTINGQSVLGAGDLTVGLTYFTESYNNSAPNATVPVAGFSATGAVTNIDFALMPKGAGALTAQVANNAVSGGSKRGYWSVDLQMGRTAATQVASGNYSVAMGYSNTANGDYSVAVGYSNTASGAYSVAMGYSNTASGNVSVAMGRNNAANGDYSVAMGRNNAANGDYSVAMGYSNLASSIYSCIPGGQYARAESLGVLAYGFSGMASGQNQMSFWGGRLDTSNATPTRITANAAAASAANQLTLRDNSAFRVRGTVVARNTSTNVCKEWTFEALIKRGTNAAATAIVGTPTITSTFADTNAASWAIAVTADTTNGALAINATGAASTNIRWTAVVHSIEVA